MPSIRNLDIVMDIGLRFDPDENGIAPEAAIGADDDRGFLP